MCICANVSFGLSAVLLATGAYCVTKATRCSKRLIPLAAIPLMFGIQQFCEGLVWTGLNASTYNPGLVKVAGLTFLFFAIFLWPVWSSFSSLLLLHRRRIRVLLLVTACVGLALGTCLYLPLLIDPARLTIEKSHRSLYYNIGQSPLVAVVPGMAWQLIYLGVVAIPLMVARVRRLFNLGLAVVLAAAVSHVFFSHSAASIWCFFSAALSLYLSVLFYKMPRRERVIVG